MIPISYKIFSNLKQNECGTYYGFTVTQEGNKKDQNEDDIFFKVDETDRIECSLTYYTIGSIAQYGTETDYLYLVVLFTSSCLFFICF